MERVRERLDGCRKVKGQKRRRRKNGKVKQDEKKITEFSTTENGFR